MTKKFSVCFRSQLQLWHEVGSPDIDVADDAFCTLVSIAATGKMQWRDPATRLYEALLLRGEQVTARMIDSFIKLVGEKIAHPRLIRLHAKKVEEERPVLDETVAAALFDSSAKPAVKRRETPKAKKAKAGRTPWSSLGDLQVLASAQQQEPVAAAA